MLAVAKESCKVCPGRRVVASYRRSTVSRLSRASCILLSQGSQDQFELLWFREIRHVQLSLGQSATDSTLRGQTIETGTEVH